MSNSLRGQIEILKQNLDFDMLRNILKNNDSLREQYLEFLYDIADFDELFTLIDEYRGLRVEHLKRLREEELEGVEFLKDELIALYKINLAIKNNNLTFDLAKKYFFKIYLYPNLFSRFYGCNALLSFMLSRQEDFREFFEPKMFRESPFTFFFFQALQNRSMGAGLLYRKLMEKFCDRAQGYNKRKKRVAVCTYGIFRGSYKDTLQDIIDNLAAPLDADVFIFSWDEYHVYPTLCGGLHWARRIFKNNIADIVPTFIETHETFSKEMPNTYKALQVEYFGKVDEEDFSKFASNNQRIKLYRFDNQLTLKQQDVYTKLYTGMYRCVELMKEYERNNVFEYDYVVIARNDADVIKPLALEVLEKMGFDEVADGHFEMGTGQGMPYGKRAAVLALCNYLYEIPFLSLPHGGTWENHQAFFYYSQIMRLKNVNFERDLTIRNTKCLSGIKLPDIKESVKTDLEFMRKNGISEENIAKCRDFFDELINEYGILNIDETRATITGTNDVSQFLKITDKDIQFKLGNEILQRGGGGIKRLYAIYRVGCKLRKYYKTNGSIVESNNEKIQQTKQYKIGCAFLKAYKTRYIGGYIKFLFDFRKIKNG